MRECHWQSLTTGLAAGAVCEAVGNFAEHPLLGEGTVFETLIFAYAEEQLVFLKSNRPPES